MSSSKEIRGKIKSVQSTRKITKAMEMVAASKMKKAQDRMRASRPYLERVFNIVIHIAKANTEYRHPFLTKRENVKRVGAIVVTTDKGLCGGLNTNVLRLLLSKHKEWTGAGLGVDYVAIGTRGLAFLSRMGASVVASAVQLGDRPHLDRVVGPVKALLDKYLAGEVDEVGGLVVVHHHVGPAPVELDDPVVVLVGLELIGGRSAPFLVGGEQDVEGHAQARQ